MAAVIPTTAAAEQVSAPPRIDSGYRRMWQIAWPVAVSTSIISLFQVANLVWVGYLGTDAIAAVAMSGHVLFITFGFTQVVFVGALAIIARRVGEGRRDDAYFAAIHAVILGAILGAILAVAGWVTAPAVVGFFGATDTVNRLAIPYLQISLAGQLPFFVSMAVGAAYSATGDTRTPMIVNSVSVALNALIDPFLIFARGERFVGALDVGWLGWGVYGAAVGNVVSAFVGLAIFLAVSVALDRPLARPRGHRLVLEPATLWQIVRIGIPASASFVFRPLSTFLLIRVIASFGTAALAAFGIALRSFSINWIPYSGVNAAVAALVGQNLGAGDVPQAARVVSRGVRIATLLAIAFCVIYGSFAAQFIAFFDADPTVVAIGVPFVQLVAFGFLATGTTLPLVAAMNGAGDTRPAMIVTFLANWPLKLPLCWLLAIPFAYGTNGVWIGMLVSMLVEAAIIVWFFRRGTWKTRRI
jgi:putative MATE family efflux protein